MTGIKTNCWNHSIAKPQDVVSNARIRPQVERLLDAVALMLGHSDATRARIISVVFEGAATEADEIEYERLLKKELVADCDPSMMQIAIRDRSLIIFDEIKEHFVGQSLLDVGCGNGLISQMSRPHFDEIQLLDVVNYVDPEINLPYLPYKEGSAFPFDRSYDTVLLLTVLHHSNDPVTLLKEAWRVTGRRLIIIESVFGVFSSTPEAEYELAGNAESEQIAFAIFVDWLYNRVLNNDIPVPYNFTTPARWLDEFAAHGMNVSAAINLGQDIRIAPELHYMFVLDR